MYVSLPKRACHAFALLVLASLSFNSAFAQIAPLLYEPEEEFMEIELPFNDPASVITEDPCSRIHSVSVTEVDYEDFARITLESDGFVPQLRVVNTLTGEQSAAVQLNNVATLDLSPGSYQVIGIDNCGKQEVLSEFMTHEYDADAIVKLDQAAYDAVVAWQRDPRGKDFYEHIVSYNKLSDQQKLSLLQTAVFKGEAYSNKFNLTKSVFPPNPFKQKKGSQKKSASTCQCTTFQLTADNNIYPIDRIRSTGQILANYGDDGDDEQTRNNLKIWWAWALEGPSRYQQLWGDTKSCVNAPYAWGWNRGNESASRDITADDIEPTYQAKIEYTMLCITGYGHSGDCSCERQVDFEYEYNSIARAQAATESGGTFCGSNRYARASVVDFAQVAFSEVNDPDSYQVLASMINGEKSECSQSWTGPEIEEFLTFAHSVYKLAKGGTVNSSDPSIDGEEEDAWSERHIEAVIEQVGQLFDEPWLTRTPCGGSVVGTENQIREGNFRYNLIPNTPIRIVLAAGSHLSVEGLRRWNANARLHSSFRLASVQRGGRNYSYGTHCCFPGVGTYMLSCISGDVPGGPSLSSWQNATEGFLTAYGVYTDISGEREAGAKVNSPISGCSNVVITTANEEDEEQISANVSFLADLDITTDNLNDYTSYSVYDVTGRLVGPARSLNQFDLATLMNGDRGQLTTGIHIVVFHKSDGTHKSRKLLVR